MTVARLRCYGGTRTPADVRSVVYGHSLAEDIGGRVAALVGLDVGEVWMPNASVYTGTGNGVGPTYSLYDGFEEDVHAEFYTPGDTHRLYAAVGLIELNDFAHTAAELLADMQDLSELVGSFGWELWPCTICATSEYDHVSPHPTRGNLTPLRESYNTLVRSAFGARVADWGSVSSLRALDGGGSPTNNQYNAAIFSDGTHLTGGPSGGRQAAAACIAETYP